MELVSNVAKCDENSFQPYREVTVKFPIEFYMDAKLMQGEDEVALLVGRRFMELLKQPTDG